MDDGSATEELAQALARLKATQDRLDQAEAMLRRNSIQDVAFAIELQRRIRNMLGTIRSVFSRTMETAVTLEDAADHFRGRLDAIARHHAQFTRSSHDMMDLEELVREELLVFGFGNGERVIIEGAEMQLPYSVAEMLALALHELATNSVKYGALAVESGQLAVRWSDDTRAKHRRLIIDWVETGVPIVAAAPFRNGFGREYIEHALPYQLDAITSFKLRPGGLACRISLSPGEPSAT